MNTPAEITKYILGLDSLGNAGLLGWITSELSHDPKMAALVCEYRETIDAKSLSPSGVATDPRDSNAVQDVSVKNGTPDAGSPQPATV